MKKRGVGRPRKESYRLSLLQQRDRAYAIKILKKERSRLTDVINELDRPIDKIEPVRHRAEIHEAIQILEIPIRQYILTLCRKVFNLWSKEIRKEKMSSLYGQRVRALRYFRKNVDKVF